MNTAITNAFSNFKLNLIKFGLILSTIFAVFSNSITLYAAGADEFKLGTDSTYALPPKPCISRHKSRYYM